MKNLVSQLARGGADLMPADLEADLNEQISQESMSQLMEEAPQNFKEGEVVRGENGAAGHDRPGERRQPLPQRSHHRVTRRGADILVVMA